ncbi:MAG TPA: hypothetical protein VKP65_20100 [Rhodothermales bacterium]|nr:hypothetical protein [Rhodothermales bacterium]
MKTHVNLGCLQVLVEADDYKDLIRQAWTLWHLNEAVAQEGFEPGEWMPYCEDGADGNEYAGFAHLTNGKRIRLGKTKAGEWYVRGKGSEHYRPPENWGSGSNQFPAASEAPKVEGKAKLRPANGTDYQAKIEALQAFLDGADDPEKSIAQARANISRYPAKWKKAAEKIIDDFAAKLQPSGDFEDESDLPF